MRDLRYITVVNSSDFIDGLHRMQRLLNIPTKQNDNTSVLQAMSKLVSDKFSPEAMQQALNEAHKPKNEKEVQYSTL